MINSTDKTRLRHYIFIGLTAAVVLALTFVHLWKIDSIPSGLYVDEAAIGQNAAAIHTNLTDQHDQFLPIYFQALGDYKNPVYIYTAAAIFQITGVSELTLRLTSALFFLITTAGTVLLVKKVFPRHPITIIYSILAVGTLPWLFTFSRLSFDTITQPAIYIWALYFIYLAYQQVSTKATIYDSLIAGLLTGLAFYTAPTSRFLSFILLIALLVVYRSPEYWKRHVFFLTSFIASLIPHLYFLKDNPGLQTKVGFISYFFASDLSLWDKLKVLFVNYLSYFDPFFLLVHGDQNLRHHTGTMGQIYLAVAILAILGLSFTIVLRNSNHKYFGWLLLIGGLTAPLAAAITDQSHAQLSVMFGFYILLMSIYGMAALEFLPKKNLKLITIGTLSVLLIAQSALYLNQYFTDYPQKSTTAFESAGFDQTMAQAAAQRPQRIVVSDKSNSASAHLGFYQALDSTANSLQNIDVAVEVPLANPDTCIITFKSNPSLENPANLTATYTQTTDYTSVTCF